MVCLYEVCMCMCMCVCLVRASVYICKYVNFAGSRLCFVCYVYYLLC